MGGGVGFPEEFINWVALTQQEAYVQILNNGYSSDCIKLNQGLAQGCGYEPIFVYVGDRGLSKYD